MLDYFTSGLIPQLLINGILYGTMYGIAAIGLSLIFGTMRIIFLAQGTIIILMAYLCYWLFSLFTIDPYFSLIIVLPISMLVGVGFYQGLFRKAAALEDKNTSLLIAVGLMFLVESLMSVLWSPNPRSIRTAYTAYGMTAMGMTVSFTRLMAFVMALLSVSGVTAFLNRTLMGKAIRAASEDMLSAQLIGISPHRVNSVAFAIGIGLTGAAGVAVATTYSFDPYFGFIFSLKAMIALALGGIGSLAGAFVGGVILGVLESMASFFISSGWSDAVVYGVFLMVLMFKPEGLLVRSYKKD
jgi:branched-chain amino acid transport system permease protein